MAEATLAGAPPALHSAKLAAIGTVRHGFFGRQGGHSGAPNDSLNVSLRLGDEPKAVGRNRAAILRSLQLEPHAWRQGHQVHGDRIVQLTCAAEHAHLEEQPLDGLVTDVAREGLVVLTADCVPILLSHRAGRGVAAIHAGWRGTASAIARHGVTQMCRILHAEPHEIVAALGPSIGPCCYQVGEEVVSALAGAFDAQVLGRAAKSDRSEPQGPQRFRLNLWALNAHVLAAAGVLPQNIDTLGVCTMCQVDRYFSYRKEGGRTGRQASVIALLP